MVVADEAVEEVLARQVLDLVGQPGELLQMARASRELGRVDAAERVLQVARQVTRRAQRPEAASAGPGTAQ